MMAVWLMLAAAAPLPGAGLVAEGLQETLSSARVGQWVTFELSGSDRPYFWRIAAVAEQRDDEGRPAVWLELELGSHPAMRAPMVQLKLLVARGGGLDARAVSQAFIAFGADRPRALAQRDLPRFFARDNPVARAATPLSRDLHVRRGEPTRLLTFGGTVTATPVETRFRDTVIKRFWLCDAVPLLHLAQLELPALGYALEARDWGLGAKPQMAPAD